MRINLETELRHRFLFAPAQVKLLSFLQENEFSILGGNVRELNIIERILVLKGNKSIIDSHDLPAELGMLLRKTVYFLRDGIEGFERGLIKETLESCRWNQTKAVEELKIARRILRYKMQKYKLGNGKKENSCN